MAAALLIVEDSDEDYHALLRALERVGARVAVDRAVDADEALEALRGDGGGAALPAVVLLDLNLPGSDGREVLAEAKATKRLRQLPIVVLSASANPATIAECYERGAAGYLIKPLDFQRLEAMIRTLKEYWLDTVQLPEGVAD